MLVLLWQFFLAKENCKWGDFNSFTWGIIQNELYTCSEDYCLFAHDFLFICDYFCEKYDKKKKPNWSSVSEHKHLHHFNICHQSELIMVTAIMASSSPPHKAIWDLCYVRGLAF